MKRTYAITPPEALEKRLLADFPDLDARVEDMLAVRDELPWPDWCFLPMAASYAIVTNGADIPLAKRYITNVGIDIFRAMSAIVPWRLNKVIYRFDRDLADELMQKESSPDDVPVQVLYHMPYPCVYIENPPGLEDRFDGLFCFLEWDHRYPEATELRMHYLAKSGSIVALYIQWSDNRSLLCAHMESNAQKLMREIRTEPKSNATDEEYHLCISHMYQHLNLLLYLCSEEPDIEHRQPIPRKRGFGSVQTASYPDRMDVGTYIGATIRKNAAQERYQSDEKSELSFTKHYRPHMRRAHWHLYWTGTGRTIPRVKWVSPIFINADHADAPSAVIHPVKE